MYQLQHQRLATSAQCQKVLLHFLSNGVQDFLLFPSFNSLLTSGFECKSHFKRLHLLPGQWQHISVWPSLCVSKNWLPRAAAALSGVVDVLPFFFFFVFSPNRNVGAGIIGHRRLFHLRRAVCKVNMCSIQTLPHAKFCWTFSFSEAYFWFAPRSTESSSVKPLNRRAE